MEFGKKKEISLVIWSKGPNESEDDGEDKKRWKVEIWKISENEMNHQHNDELTSIMVRNTRNCFPH